MIMGGSTATAEGAATVVGVDSTGADKAASAGEDEGAAPVDNGAASSRARMDWRSAS